MLSPKLETERLILRRYKESDIDAIYDIITDERLSKYIKFPKLTKLMLDCDVENLGSSKTMEALGGKLERTEIDPYDGILTSVYWINVDESLEKYKDEYDNFIDKSYGKKVMK